VLANYFKNKFVNDIKGIGGARHVFVIASFFVASVAFSHPID